MTTIVHPDHAVRNWQFPDPPGVGCVTTRQVMEKQEPIRAILRDEDGEWQFLCETTTDPKDGQIACLACMVESFPFIVEHANLQVGYEAVRASDQEPWQVQKSDWVK